MFIRALFCFLIFQGMLASAWGNNLQWVGPAQSPTASNAKMQPLPVSSTSAQAQFRPIDTGSLVDRFAPTSRSDSPPSVMRTSYQWPPTNDLQALPRPQLNSGPMSRDHSVLQVQGFAMPGASSQVAPASPIPQNPLPQNSITPVLPPPQQQPPATVYPNSAPVYPNPVPAPAPQLAAPPLSQSIPRNQNELVWNGPAVATVDNSPCVTAPVQYAFSDPCGCGPFIQPASYATTVQPPPATFVPPPAVIAPPVVMPGGVAPAYYSENGGFRPLISLGQENYNVQLGRGIVGQPTAYVPGQTIRNFFRYLFP